MTKRRLPVVLLIRRVTEAQQPIWLFHSAHRTNQDAEREWAQHIKGRGITAWSWWGPSRIADKMLADPTYNPDTEAVPVARLVLRHLDIELRERQDLAEADSTNPRMSELTREYHKGSASAFMQARKMVKRFDSAARFQWRQHMKP